MNRDFASYRAPLALVLLFALALSFLQTQGAALEWPQWRGPERSDLSKESGLLKSWPAEGPRRVWLFENAGQGYSGPAIAGGKLFTIGTREGAEILLALDANTGKELWTANVGEVLENNWGDGPRGTPSVDGDRVYALSGAGNLLCAAVADGKVHWTKSMDDLGGQRPRWGFTESVLVDGQRVLCTPGGSRGALAALNKATGEVLWQSKEFTDGAQYASMVPATFHGVPQYVQLTMNSIVGIAAADGKKLWRSDWPGRTAVIPTPICYKDHVYVTSGYGVGCKLVRIGPGNQASDVYENKVMKNHHGGVILVGEHLYGHSDGAGWICQEFLTGNEVWCERSKLGKGAIGYADGMFYCLEEDSGTVALIEASPTGWREHGRFKLSPQTKIRSSQGRIWTHPVVCNGKLYLRDQDLIYCFDVKSSSAAVSN